MFATDTSSTTKKMKGDLEAEIVQSLLSGGGLLPLLNTVRKIKIMKISDAKEIKNHLVKNHLQSKNKSDGNILQ